MLKIGSVLLLLSCFGATFGASAQSFDTHPERSRDPRIRSVARTSVVLYKRGTRFGVANFCSGSIVRRNRKSFLLTAAHCIPNKSKCSTTNLVRDYDSTFYLGHEMEYVEDEIVRTGYALEHLCENLIYINPALDVALFSISEPIGSNLKNLDLPATELDIPTLEEFSRSQGEEILFVGSPAGYRKTGSFACYPAILNPTWDEGLKIQTNCYAVGGSSGSVTHRRSDGRVSGVVITALAADADRRYYSDFELGKKPNTTVTNLSLVREDIDAVLAGKSELPGVLSFDSQHFYGSNCMMDFAGVLLDKSLSRETIWALFRRVELLLFKSGKCKSMTDGKWRPIRSVIPIGQSTSPEYSYRSLWPGLSDQEILQRINENGLFGGEQ